MSDIEILHGIVTKIVGGVFAVETETEKFTCYSPKKLRKDDSGLFVGDRVSFVDLHRHKGNIVEIFPRKNRLNRPEVANIDVCFVVLACVPQPDYYLVDKILVNCFQEKIEPVIVVNKIDLGNNTAEAVKKNYGKICDIICLSALAPDSVTQLRKYVEEQVACFAGQSAVGKTSILNAILPGCCGEIGGISEKSKRGMHTTRHSSLHAVWNGYLADTCGFSLCDLNGIRSDELRLYFDDFVNIARNCKYTSCTHTVEPDCAVRNAVEQGLLCKARYERYLEEYRELLKKEENRF